MRRLAFLLALGLAGKASAAEAVVRSPESAQTYTYHTIVWQQLRRPAGSRALVASITFSNLNWDNQFEPRKDERFDFTFPEVTFDEATGTFYAPAAAGGKIPVAAIQSTWLGKQIRLAPGTNIEISSHQGKIHVQLMANSESREKPQWIERGL